MGGVTGLDYTALQSALIMMNIDKALWPDLFEDIRVLEVEALSVINKKD